MSERAADQPPEPLPRPTRRQLVIRSIGTALVIAALTAALLVVIDARREPTDVTDLVQEPRTVSFGRVSLQIPADWTNLADVDDCGHVQGDTLILGLAGVVTCPEGERDPEASDVVMSALGGETAAPAPAVRLRPVTLPSGLRGRRGTATLPVPPAENGEEGRDDDDPRLRTTVLRIPALDVQVLATSPDRELVRGILNSVRRIPPGSPATTTVAYLFAAVDMPRSWPVNAVDCAVPVKDTVILGQVPEPRARSRRQPCTAERPTGVSDITLEALDSPFGRRWGPLANDPVTLLGGVKGLHGSRVMPDGLTLTVVVVPSLRAIAVARSFDTAVTDLVLSTMHRAVPAPPDKDEPTPTTTPEPTPRATLPAGVKTRTVRSHGVALAVPTRWSTDDVRCGVPRSDTVVLGMPTDGPDCATQRPPGISDLVVDRLYGSFGSLWRDEATEPVTLPSGLSGMRGSTTSTDGLPVTVLAFPTIDVVLVATAARAGRAQDLVDGFLTTTRELTTRPSG